MSMWESSGYKAWPGCGNTKLDGTSQTGNQCSVLSLPQWSALGSLQCGKSGWDANPAPSVPVWVLQDSSGSQTSDIFPGSPVGFPSQ